MTQSSTHDSSMLVIKRELVDTPEKGWLSGFGNILGKELSDWFGTRRWWVQSLVWLIILNVGLAIILFVLPNQEASAMHMNAAASGSAADLYQSGLAMFFNTLAMLGSIGIIVLTQDEIIQEKQSGTAAWILTKPVSRASFILSKVLSNAVGASIFILAIPALAAYLEIFAATGFTIPLLPYIEALAVMLLTFTFYIALSLMLGTFFQHRGPILAGTFGVLLGGMILAQFWPILGDILPLNMDRVAMAVLQGQELSPAMGYQLITAAFFSFLFIVAALWRFGDEEF